MNETTVYVTPTRKNTLPMVENFSPTSLENAKSIGLDPCKVYNRLQ